MKFKIEIWHSTTEFETIEIEAIDSIYATKFATQFYPKSIKINVKSMRKLATKLTPAIKEWIKEEFNSDFYETEMALFHFPNYENYNGFLAGEHTYGCLLDEYTEVSEQEFLAEFGKKIEYQYLFCGEWININYPVRIKPTPDYSKEIEALQEKAKENGMKVTVNFKKI